MKISKNKYYLHIRRIMRGLSQIHYIFFTFGIILLNVESTCAQTASGNWALTIDGSASVIGNTSALTQSKGSSIGTESFGATNGCSANTWNAASLSVTSYYEYDISPTSGNTLTINNISFFYSISGGSMNAAVYYSLNAFSTSTQLNTNIVGLSNTSSTTQFVSSPTITVTSGQTLAVRVYGWGADANTRTFRNKTFLISGTSGITSFQNGDWNTTTTWVGGIVPPANSTVILNHAVTAAASILQQTNILISNGASLYLTQAYTNPSGGTLTVASGGTLAMAATYTNSGTTNINGTFQLNTGGFSNGANGFVYGAAGTLAFNAASAYGVNNTDTYWPAASGPFNVSILAGGLNLGSSSTTSRTVAGTFQTASGVSLSSSSVLTLTGTCQLNTGGFFNNAPTIKAGITAINNLK